MTEFEKFVLDAIWRWTPHPGARLPTPVPTMRAGELTQFGKSVVKRNGCKPHSADDAVLKAVFRLEHQGQLKRIDRYGYSWIVPSSYTDEHSGPLSEGVSVPFWADRYVKELETKG